VKTRQAIILIIQTLLLLLIYQPESGAQPKRLQFKYLTPDNGLSSSIASCIFQDHKGFMWIGTPDGLNRYDGISFVVYKSISGDSSSLADNVIKTLFEDHNKNLFIGTENGLSMYDRENDCFLNYVWSRSSPLYGIVCTVSKIAEDSAGNLFLATSVGLIYFDRQNNKIIQHAYSAGKVGGISNSEVESVLEDSKGRLWVATRGGLNLFDRESGTFRQIVRDEKGNDLSKAIFINIVEDRDGNIWIGGIEGLYCLKKDLKPGNEYLVHYVHDPIDKNSLSINSVRCTFVDDMGNLWIGTDNGGLNLFNTEKNNFWQYRKDDYDSQSLSNEAIESIFQDKTGNLWLGTYTGGINITLRNREAIIKYSNLPGALQSLSHNTVTCFTEDSKGDIWVGTDGGGMNLFDRKTERFKRYNINNSGLSSNAILCIHEAPDEKLWIGTWAGGLVKFDINSGKMTCLTTKNSGIQDDNIHAIEEGYNNDLWLGTFEHGLIHYQIKENKFTEYTPQNSGIGNEMVLKISRFSGGRLLIATTMNFQIFSPDKNQFITYIPDPGNPNSLSYPRVTDFLIENDSCIWIGTPEGLNRFNPVKGSFTRYYEKDGLPDNFIEGLMTDSQGILWVTTNNGVSRFDTRLGKFKNYTRADGFQSNEFSERSISKTRDGAILMGGTKGFNILHPEKISENKTIPDVVITELKIFNKSVRPGKDSQLSKNITELKSLTLPHELSVITLSFAAMDFSAPEKNQFAYMMENFDRSWIFSGNKAEATYTNLNPGNYIFHVKASNNDGVWNETGTSIKLTILPPWWLTWWFKLIGGLIIVLILSSFYLYRVTQLKNQKILLEKTVAIKTAELKELNASKDKFFSIIAHDLKNPFSTIIGFSKILFEEISPDNCQRNREIAGMINSSASQTFSLLENLLEWANSQRGKIPFNPGQLQVSDLINEEFTTLHNMAAAKNIELKFSDPENLSVFADKNMINTILRNLISNAIKFTRRNGTIDVIASSEKDGVRIGVSDNGIGITADTMSKLFKIDSNLTSTGTENEKGTGLGLFLCKELVLKHGGKIWAESEPGNGSVFFIVLPFAKSQPA
jgi:ligand-binding sensor domain-containing protein/signal transduction histidine kinase